MAPQQCSGSGHHGSFLVCNFPSARDGKLPTPRARRLRPQGPSETRKHQPPHPQAPGREGKHPGWASRKNATISALRNGRE